MRASLDWSAGGAGGTGLHITLAGAIGWIWLAAGLRREGLRHTTGDCLRQVVEQKLRDQLALSLKGHLKYI